VKPAVGERARSAPIVRRRALKPPLGEKRQDDEDFPMMEANTIERRPSHYGQATSEHEQNQKKAIRLHEEGKPKQPADSPGHWYLTAGAVAVI